ncbi:thiolase family protein [Caviibacter abscessus]|uniref:thiolase family protein n=1 Tax=Caviibacter abscessus TaxID=1766719 RepID=UPI0008353E40|nr:thiolase family protein [Caviibacter abscessus]
MNKVVIVGALRSAIGVYKKTFNDIDLIDMSSIVLKDLLQKSKISYDMIDEVIMGNVLQSNRGQNIARQIAIKTGLSQKTSAYTVNMVCGSGMKAITLGANSIISGENEIVVVGGCEHMSSTPIETILKDGLTDAFSNVHMGITAENIVKKYNFSRKQLDEFSLKSQLKAEKATIIGKFNEEIVPINNVSKDEFIRYGQTLDKLSSLKPAFTENGIVTAGNSTGINDGAAMLLLMSEKKAKELNLEILAYINSYANCGLDPNYMGLGPIYSTRKLLEKNNINIESIDIFEINEAFAAQSLAVIKELNIDENKVNVNGGAIALGHPIGASGARIVVSLVHEMIREEHKRGIASLCIGGGQGISILLTRGELK